MSLIAGNSAQRDQAASAFGGSYAAAKAATDVAATAVVAAQDEKNNAQQHINSINSDIESLKEQLSIASDQDTIDTLNANIESLENAQAKYTQQIDSLDYDIQNLTNNFNLASENEQKVLMEMLASGEIKVGNLDNTKLIDASGFNGVTPASPF